MHCWARSPDKSTAGVAVEGSQGASGGGLAGEGGTVAKMAVTLNWTQWLKFPVLLNTLWHRIKFFFQRGKNDQWTKREKDKNEELLFVWFKTYLGLWCLQIWSCLKCRDFCVLSLSLYLSTWSAQVDTYSQISLQNPELCLLGGWGEAGQSPGKEWRWRGDRKDLQNSHCWAKPDFEYKIKRSAKMVGTFFFSFLLSLCFFPFLSLLPSAFFSTIL